MNPSKPACLLALSAYPAQLESGLISTTFALSGHMPRLLVTIRKAEEIEPAIRRFGQAVALLWPFASFSIVSSHQKRPWGSPSAEAGRKVPKWDATMDRLRSLHYQWVRSDQAMQGSRLEDEPLPVAMPEGTVGDEWSMVQTIAFAIRADLMARRMKSAA